MDYSVRFIMGLVVAAALMLILGLIVSNHVGGGKNFISSMVTFN